MSSFVRYALQQSKTRLWDIGGFAVQVGLSRSDTSFWSQAKIGHDKRIKSVRGRDEAWNGDPGGHVFDAEYRM